MRVFVLLGPPGSGKSTQGQNLAINYGVPFVSAGNLLREEVNKGTAFGHMAVHHMARGEMVQDELTIAIVCHRICQADCAHGFILDGFPRNRLQAEALALMLKQQSKHLSSVILLNVGDEEVIARLSGRRICPDCGAIYHIVFNPPIVGMICYACHTPILAEPDGSLKCEVCSNPITQREDDKPEVIRNRLKTFWRETRPLIEYYKRLHLLREIDASGPPNDVLRRLMESLDQAAA